VGEAYWSRTQKYLIGYKRRRQNRSHTTTGGRTPKTASI
jgi:hypothetical protein